MDEDNVVGFRRPDDRPEDLLTEVLRHGARALLAQAIEAEVATFLATHADLVDGAGRRRLVRNGFLPERTIQTGIGAVPVCQPRVRDRAGSAPHAKIRFTSVILPRYRAAPARSRSCCPWLYLKGISSGDFSEALAALLGPDAPGLSASTIGRMKEAWQAELAAWQARDLTGKRYVYFWADGVYFNARLDQERQCILVVIGADEGAARSWSGSPMATAERAVVATSCSSTSATAASRSGPSSPSATAISASGRRCARSTVPLARSAAGFTRRPTS